MTPDALKSLVTSGLYRNLDPFTKTSYAAFQFLSQVFGHSWIEQYTVLGANADFLRVDAVNGPLGYYRIIDLAETILNFRLQQLPGLDEVLDKLATGNIESACAELDTGRLMTVSLTPFGFHPSGGRRGDSYDFDAQFVNNTWGCAEVECKIESKPIRQAGIKHSLDHARKQLPRDRPGVIFLKLPEVFRQDQKYLKRVAEVIRRFLRGTQRIVCVVYYVRWAEAVNNGMRDGFSAFEIVNGKHRFGGDVAGWNLLRTTSPGANEAWISVWNMFGSLRRPEGVKRWIGHEDSLP